MINREKLEDGVVGERNGRNGLCNNMDVKGVGIECGIIDIDMYEKLKGPKKMSLVFEVF